ncbi:MAG: FAD-dependent thymidylate synthase [Patescibacteria group bacterium]|nr:FAD-dependent thymidylate synthase [Patescibacteria group bacterium]
MPAFTPEERELLEKYVTSATDNVFAVNGLPGLVGAVYARYSRAKGGFRETLLKEFIKEGNIDADKAQDLIERVLIAFGDDSVGELEGAHVSFEGISMIATKELEDRRIGGSPIEISTRYVTYDRRDDDGNYLYIRPDEIMASKHAEAYTDTMDFIFDTYAELVGPMQDYFKRLKPLNSAEYDIDGDGRKEKFADLTDENDIKAFRRTYKMDIRTKACDTLRYILPLSTKANMGIFGNGRFFQGVLSHCYTSPIPEVRRIAEKAHQALDRHIPRYVQRAKHNEYTDTNRSRMTTLTKDLTSDIEHDTDGYIALTDRANDQEEADVRTIASMLYQYADTSLNQLCGRVSDMQPEERQVIIDTYVGDRRSRRDRPGRAFESDYPYLFDMLTDWGTYKDLMRHRMTTQIRQKFSPLLGFSMPPDLENAGFADRARKCHERATELYERLLPDFPEEASYATLHGSKVRWMIGFNDREAFHLLELRTIPQGHASYRKASQEMHRLIAERSPWRAEVMNHVDHNDYAWARADSEARQRVKERALERSGLQI